MLQEVSRCPSRDKLAIATLCACALCANIWLHYSPLPQIDNRPPHLAEDAVVWDFTQSIKLVGYVDDLDADDGLEIGFEESESENQPEQVEQPEPESEPQPAYYLSSSERHTVECIIAGEAGNEDLQEMMLVAQTIWQNCVDDNLSPSQVRKKYQYAGWKEISGMPQDVQDNVKAAVDRIFINGEKVVSAPIKVFYNPHIAKSKWHESQRHIITAKSGTKFFAYKD